MFRLITRRIGTMILTMLFVSIAVFVATEATPGNIARHVLGNFVTPEQEAAFLKQLGLDQPLPSRYLTWLVGSDWRAANLVGMPLARVKHPGADYYEWWAVTADGRFVRWDLKGEDLIAQYLQPDGSTVSQTENFRWRTLADGTATFWGINLRNSAALWQKGGNQSYWMRARSGGYWTEQKGGAVRYIPLQKGLLRGDPGESLVTGRPVGDIIGRRLRNSLLLAAISFVFMMPLALFLGILAGVKQGSWIDRVLSVGGLTSTATPEFATGVFLILIFSSWLHILPGATVFTSEQAAFENPTMLLLPVLTLTLIELGYVMRITRASMVEVMDTCYIRTAILKGLPDWYIVWKHALRNALMAPITVILLHIGWLIGGIVVVEAIFGFPGLGRYMIDAAFSKDVSALAAGTIVFVAIAVLTQLVADIVYTYLNPRVRYA